MAENITETLLQFSMALEALLGEELAPLIQPQGSAFSFRDWVVVSWEYYVLVFSA